MMNRKLHMCVVLVFSDVDHEAAFPWKVHGSYEGPKFVRYTGRW